MLHSALEISMPVFCGSVWGIRNLLTGSHWISDDYHFENKPTVTQGQAKEVRCFIRHRGGFRKVIANLYIYIPAHYFKKERYVLPCFLKATFF
jgi:hypothetical protein